MTTMLKRFAVQRSPLLLRPFATAPPVPRPLHLLIYTYTEDAVDKRAPYRAAHLALALESEQLGELLLGGALAEPVDGGVLAFAGRAVAENFARADPYVLNGIVVDWTVREWTVVVGSLSEQLPPPPPFVATYEWKVVGANDELPSGLEIELPLDSVVKVAFCLGHSWPPRVPLTSLDDVGPSALMRKRHPLRSQREAVALEPRLTNVTDSAALHHTGSTARGLGARASLIAGS